MKGTISFAEVMSLAKCIGKFEGGFIEKNYQGENGVSFKLRKSGIDSVYLHFVDGKFLFLSQENEIEGKKNSLPVENSPVTRIRQLGTDRVLLIEGPKTVVIEMMGGGNVFVLQEGLIIYSRKPGKRRGNIMKVGERYEFPQYIDLRSPEFDFSGAIGNSTSDPVRTLAVRLGLSKYADEIICALGLASQDNSSLLDNILKIKDMILHLYSCAEEGKLYVYGDEFYIWKSYCRKDEPEVMNIEDGLLKVYRTGKSEGNNRLEAMRRNVEKMTQEMGRLRNIGEYIMSHLAEVDRLLKGDWKKDPEKYRVDYERETISFADDGMEIELRINETAGENADNYFAMSKRIKDKLARVDMEPRREEEKVELKKVKRVFTNYRWFITSDGNLVIGGRDAESNDSVVKKYLGEKDLYFHADIHGAPSVVMKVTKEPTEKGIEEAAQFSWCMSKAWNTRIGNGSVFYVTKSQVSKTPESGEYLARGAWVIRGRKNYITHLNLELAVGFQKYENREYVVAAPISAISGMKVIIVPGDGKEEVVNEISDLLKVEKESVYPVLPPGSWSVRESIAP
ncbi:MAG: NFACT family protein [Candidatus Thermoplasmatota archaeon]|jgi:predicted ribosome quality control (RQC) complex YloA/Tae2 family protein|nr:NFACT family protein [Candidatus Thermoplasmatota archaeon]MCL5929982.1 NFACT family protein [Candidatus Thermoplasmatota archaeon]